ncbi:hypothetical protein S40288_00972 [Stachybotrys chartarum IBT 40288]|nr:hypothetical protein S40288_00972 [Stachybotrys chartarum IBT 40288]
MNTTLELFVLPWGVYPRRVLLYLSEKGLSKSPNIKITPVSISASAKLVAKGKPGGTVPVLKLPDGSFIKQSVAILQYFEEVCSHPDPEEPWQGELAKLASKESMLGRSAKERARARDMLSLTDEATMYFGFACHKGSRLFETREQMSPLASRFAFESCRKSLGLLEQYYAEQKSIGQGRQVNICDCALYSLLHFSKEMYGKDLCSEPELPNLQCFYQEFGQRESAQVSENHFPEQFQAIAAQWLPDEEDM